ncbi:peroxiredoxin [Actinobacteria bacterium YIM 96077]|uniref:Alkyl hydroperoxide reductase E n=1 Tax=Phytoactinopolyspora halophila TaxID=1981511 RepID=A0A329QY80_9ACTN|nr:peroxiredoxin [Phytoactinopolyspora halophila]AYY13858.1 peroxiredoxin [Actinobacteria bacterium YIM 96077]RAW15598.1 peroxiredoxin [Phytoactinopolyspora halophila]
MTLIGTPAPDFERPDQHGRTWRLSALRGHAVVIVFFPFAFTRVCTGELAELRDEMLPSLPDGTVVLAMSCDSMFALRVFAESEKLEFPLLSDFWPHGVVASSYGVFDEERGCARRGSFLIDAKGIVRWSVVNAIPNARDVDDYRRALDGLAITSR